MLTKIILFTILCCSTSTIVFAQKKTYQIKADTVRIFNSCDTAELVLENRTRNILDGVLTNKGNGVTEFRKVMTRLNDSTYLVGGDTLKSNASGKNIYNSDGVVTSKRIIHIDSNDIKFQNAASFLIANKRRPVVVSRSPVDSTTFNIINNVFGSYSPFSGLAVRGQGCDATIALISDSMGTCNEGQAIDFTVLKPGRGAWINTVDPANTTFNKYLLGRIQLETSNRNPNISFFKVQYQIRYSFYNDGAYSLVTPGGSTGYTPGSIMQINPSYRHPQGYHTKMPFVRINGGLFVGFNRSWYGNSRNANDIIPSVDDNPGYLQAFYETRFSVYADSLPLKIFKLPTMKGSAFLTYSPGRTVDGNNVAFEYKDTVYEDIRNYIAVRGLGTPSDLNLKENISLSQFDTEKLLQLSIKDFNYKSDKSKTVYSGLIAQELKTVLPELVLGKEGNHSIDYTKMVPYLLKAIQDQQKEIDSLKQKQTAGSTSSTDVLNILQELQKQLSQAQDEIKQLKEQVVR